MNTGVQSYFCLSLLVPVLFFAGCLPPEDKKSSTATPSATAAPISDGSEVLLTIDGQSKITVKSLDAEFDRLLEENPQLKQVLPFMPDAKSNFLQGMINQEIVDHYVAKEGIDRSAEYQKEFDRTVEQVRKMLNTKFFSDRHPVSVTDAEIVAFYEENKNKLPDLMLSQGGVKAEGVSFETEQDAQDFAKKVGAKGDLKVSADDAGFGENYRDFKMVHEQSMGVDTAIRQALRDIKRFPSVQTVNAEDKWWVIKANSKENPQYRELDEQLKASLSEYLKKQKQMDVFEKAIEGYKAQYDVQVNDAPLKPKVEEAPESGQQDQVEQKVAQHDGDTQGHHPIAQATQTV